MSELILHPGAPKTGTSFLQVMFSQHAEAMLKEGVVYPRGHMFDEAKSGEITSGNGIELANFLNPNLPHNVPDKLKYIDKFDKTLDRHKGLKVLFSSEFLTFPPGPQLEQIKTVIRKHKFSVRVVYFVRDLVPAAFSTYSQQIKRHGEHREFNEFIRDWDPFYRYNLMCMEDAFGRDQVTVYNYDAVKKGLSDIFFKDILGLSFAPKSAPVINRSLSAEEAEALRQMNSLSPGNAAISNFINTALMKLDKPKSEGFQVTKEESDLLHTRFDEAVSYINEFTHGEPCVIEDSDLPERPSAQPSATERLLMATLSQLLLRQTQS